MVFFFTGTGNSLYVAKELDNDCISIPQAIHDVNAVYKDGRIGIVCPVYGHEMPAMVKDFLKRSVFHTNYFYVVLTYGNIHGGAAELADEFLTFIGRRADYINTIQMVDNYLPAFDMEEQMEGLPKKKVEEHLAAIREDIEKEKCWKQPATGEDRDWHRAYLERTKNAPKDARLSIYEITEDCIGCGICMNICPAGCIRLENQRAIHGTENCQMCMACIHHCPKNAVRLNVPEKNPDARYHNPHIRLTELVGANKQEIKWKGKAAI